MPNKDPRPCRKLQVVEHADKPGKYIPFVRLSHSIVNPGQTVDVDVFISGLGRIGATKLAAYPSPGLINEAGSQYRFGETVLDEENLTVVHQGKWKPLDKNGCIITFFPLTEADRGRMEKLIRKYGEAYAEGPMFSLQLPGESDLRISSEMITPVTNESGESDKGQRDNALVGFHLEIQKKARPGVHGLQFVLTYFNGDRWEISTCEARFHVTSLLQRREIYLVAAFFVAAVATILSAVLSLLTYCQANCQR